MLAALGQHSRRSTPRPLAARSSCCDTRSGARAAEPAGPRRLSVLVLRARSNPALLTAHVGRRDILAVPLARRTREGYGRGAVRVVPTPRRDLALANRGNAGTASRHGKRGLVLIVRDDKVAAIADIYVVSGRCRYLTTNEYIARPHRLDIRL